jgi:uncharacterized protein (TIGR04141 family)
MAKKKKPIRHLIILLLKDKYQEPHKALIQSEKLKEYKLKESLPFDGFLFLKKPSSNPPSWLSFVQTGVDEILKLFNSSNSGILFLKESSRLFAITFGHGRYLLNQDTIERDFGLKVTLNTVNPNKLRSIDMRTLEELPLETRRQASISSSLDIFGIDVDRDVLRGVVGEPIDIKFAERIAGSDALAISTRVEFSGLGEKCKEILKFYKSKQYQESFSWIDHIKSVREPLLNEELNQKLAKIIINDGVGNIFLAPPEPLDWESFEDFYYSCDNNRHPYKDLDIEQYFTLIGDVDENSIIAILNAHRVEAKMVEIDEPFSKWSIYDCLVLQIEHKGYLYVLSRGQWFQVEKRFADRVYKDFKDIPAKDDFLIKAHKGEKEEDYNIRAAQSISGLVLLDQKNIKTLGAATPIEVCDLFSKDKEWIHIKRKTRSSSLSHLFFQGSNSAELFLRDNLFRDKVKTLLEKQTPNLSSLIPKNRPNASDYKIVYAIITDNKRKWPDCVPFFSQLSLRQQAQRLEGYRFKVLLARIVEEQN